MVRIASPTIAEDRPYLDKAPMAVPYLACMAFIAGVNHLPPRVLPSIQAV